MPKVIALIALVLVLGIINSSIAKKEAHLATGRLVFIELAPVDPRSLMQGDYMALDFVLSRKIYEALPKVESEKRWRHDVNASDGNVVVSIDQKNIATFLRLQDDKTLSENEALLFYRVRDGAVKFATNAFFFQEGHANKYTSAKYGEFRVDDHGELLLVAMRDEALNQLTAN